MKDKFNENEGRDAARERQAEKDRIAARALQRKQDAEYIRDHGSKGWLMSPKVEARHQKIPGVPVDKPKMESAHVSSVNTMSDALHAATGTGNILTLSVKTDLATVKDKAKNAGEEIDGCVGVVDQNENEFEKARAYLTDIETYANNMSGVLATNDLPHTVEDDIAVLADEARDLVNTGENMRAALKEKFEVALKILRECEEEADSIIGQVDETSNKLDELANVISGAMAG